MTGAYSWEKTTLESLFEFISAMSEADMFSIYQYALSITSLAQVAHPTNARSTGNKIQDQVAKQMEGVTLSVPLKVVQQVVDIIPTRVLAVFVGEPVKFFGLAVLSRVNYAQMVAMVIFWLVCQKPIPVGRLSKLPQLSSPNAG